MAFIRRKTVEELTDRKIAMIAALYANSNYDSSEGQDARAQMIGAIEENYEETCIKIYGSTTPEVRKIAEDDPFFAAMQVPDNIKQEAFDQ